MQDQGYESIGRVLLQEAAEPSAAPPQPNEPDIVELYSFNTALMVVLIILWSSFGHQIARRTKYMGEGSAACAMGLITGLIILISQKYFSTEQLHQLLTFNPAGFFTYLLPPIIFYAGLSVKKKRFFRNFVSIASFGILGTYIAFAVIAYVLYGFSKLPNILTLPDCLALGVIFAATDSVAVLQVLKQERMPLLYSLVFGEGVVNDATSVALLRAVQALDGSEELSAGTVLEVLGKFLYLFVASMGLGLAFGLGTSLLMKIFKSHSTPQEVALVGLLGYLSYLCGELLGLSGIVCVFCCAVAISHYALHNISSVSRVTLVSAFQTLSYLSEGAIFIYVGMDLLDPLKWKNSKPLEVLWLFCVLLLLMVLGRAAFVFPLSFVHNWWSKERLSVKEMVVIWWSGLIRGAVSVALVYYYFDPYGKTEDEKNSTLISTTILEVMTCVFVFGAATKPLLDYLLGSEVVIERDSSISMELMAGRRRSRSAGNGCSGMYTSITVRDDEPGTDAQNARRSNSHSNSSDDSSPRKYQEEGAFLGSHGQNLSELAENLPPAMAVQSQTKWAPVDKFSPGETWIEEEEAHDTPILFGKDTHGSLSSRESGHGTGRSWKSQKDELGGASTSQPAQRWNRAQIEDGTRMSSFQNGGGNNAQIASEVREEDGEQAWSGEAPGPLHNWWINFDARYMQPVFGSAHQTAQAPAVELHRRNSRSWDGTRDDPR